MSASISLTFDELPLVYGGGASAFHLMSVDARLSYTTPTLWDVREIWSDVYEGHRREPDKREPIALDSDLGKLIKKAIEDTQADYVEREIRDEIDFSRKAA